ncbi:GntR family transcriptional regulator [Ectobacillus polymachus]|uniref:GntR family transcriptional regulator n=1 Tax=Ectobacillus polymachus TaxID=1508806 RepID=UPI003A879BF7
MKEKERSSDKIEKKLIKAILAGDYSVGSTLLPERELAKEFGVGRPTVREALQRLERDGWISCRKGLPAIVNDYWRKGNLTTLVNIIQNHDTVTDEFIVYLLELRRALAPAYIHDAVIFNQPKVVSLLADLEALKDDADGYAAFDWELQKQIAGLSPNPVYLLILNSFNSFYIQIARIYFSIKEHRSLSLEYYNELLTVALQGDATEAERIAKNAMEKSLILWKNR